MLVRVLVVQGQSSRRRSLWPRGPVTFGALVVFGWSGRGELNGCSHWAGAVDLQQPLPFRYSGVGTAVSLQLRRQIHVEGQGFRLSLGKGVRLIFIRNLSLLAPAASRMQDNNCCWLWLWLACPTKLTRLSQGQKIHLQGGKQTQCALPVRCSEEIRSSGVCQLRQCSTWKMPSCTPSPC